MTDQELLERAISLATQNVESGGWPFSAIISKDDEVLAEAVNSVHISNDPSDHAEIAAIRAAVKIVGSPDLSGSTMYLLAPPCPMCFACMILAKIERVVFATSVERKDEALSRLPLTQGLYDAVSAGSSFSGMRFDHIDRFEDEGFEIFKNWNDETL